METYHEGMLESCISQRLQRVQQECTINDRDERLDATSSWPTKGVQGLVVPHGAGQQNRNTAETPRHDDSRVLGWIDMCLNAKQESLLDASNLIWPFAFLRVIGVVTGSWISKSYCILPKSIVLQTA